jgi:hypothetical protein
MPNHRPQDLTSVPRIAPGAPFVAWDDLAGRPNVVVDARPTHGTVLSLSHHPGSGSPDGLRADTSTAIVDRFLDLPGNGSGRHDVAVTNDHYDEDGLFGLWLLQDQPPGRDPARAMACAAAEAGDFSTWTRPEAAWCAITVMAMAEAPTTPLPGIRRALRQALDGDPAGALYAEILPRTRRVLEDPERFRELWEPRWSRVLRDTARLDAGEIRLDEMPEADLVVVQGDGPLDDLALMPRSAMTRVLMLGPGAEANLRYRYETWVDFASRPLPARPAFAPLADALARAESRAQWRFDDPGSPRPRLWSSDHRGRPAASSQEPARIAAIIAEHLAAGST